MPVRPRGHVRILRQEGREAVPEPEHGPEAALRAGGPRGKGARGRADGRGPLGAAVTRNSAREVPAAAGAVVLIALAVLLPLGARRARFRARVATAPARGCAGALSGAPMSRGLPRRGTISSVTGMRSRLCAARRPHELPAFDRHSGRTLLDPRARCPSQAPVAAAAASPRRAGRLAGLPSRRPRKRPRRPPRRSNSCVGLRRATRPARKPSCRPYRPRAAPAYRQLPDPGPVGEALLADARRRSAPSRAGWPNRASPSNPSPPTASRSGVRPSAATVERAFGTLARASTAATGRSLRLGVRRRSPCRASVAALISGVSGVDQHLASTDHVREPAARRASARRPPRRAKERNPASLKASATRRPARAPTARSSTPPTRLTAAATPRPLPYAVCGYTPASCRAPTA